MSPIDSVHRALQNEYHIMGALGYLTYNRVAIVTDLQFIGCRFESCFKFKVVQIPLKFLHIHILASKTLCYHFLANKYLLDLYSKVSFN
jgi:hypothetical protein